MSWRNFLPVRIGRPGARGPADLGREGRAAMDQFEDILVGLFTRLREDLREEDDVGLALRAEGPSVTLRVRSREQAGDERRPYFAVVVGAGERDGTLRVTYKTSGLPLAENHVTIVDAGSTEELLGL